MKLKLQYYEEEERQELIDKNKDKFLVEELIVYDGNFLVFDTEKPSEQNLIEMKRVLKELEESIKESKEKSELIESALIELASIILS